MARHRPLPKLATLLPLATLCLGGTGQASDLANRHVEVSLVADVAAATPGLTFHLGLLVEPDPDFHTYWKEPGVVGVPTSITWQVTPPDITPGQILWPAPERVKMAAYTAYGYRRAVLLPMAVTVPEDFSGTSLTFSGKAVWMCCHKTCHPGWRELSLTLPVAPNPRPSNLAGRFQSTLATLPVPAEGWTGEFTRSGTSLVARLHVPEGAPRPAFAYCEDGQVHSDRPQSFTELSPGLWEWRASLAPFYAERFSPPPARLPLVIELAPSPSPQGDATPAPSHLRLTLTPAP